MSATTWMRHAACRGLDPELFHPHKGASTATARAVCQACPVAVACLEHAMLHDEQHGLWGGLPIRARRRVRAAWAAGEPIHHHLLTSEEDDVEGDDRRACDQCGRRYTPVQKHQRYCRRACTLAAQRATQRDARSGGTSQQQVAS